MNPVLQQFKKDLLRLRTLFILCLVPIILKLAGAIFLSITPLFAGAGIHDVGPSLHNFDLGSPSHKNLILGLVATLMGGGIILVASLALPYLLIPLMVPLLVHEDPLVGTTAFWLTRPISRRQLLGAKLLSIGLMILLLIVDHVIPMTKIPIETIVAGIPSFFLTIATLLILITLLSSISESFGGFIILTLQGLLCWAGFSLLIWIVQKLIHHYSAPDLMGTFHFSYSGTPFPVSQSTAHPPSSTVSCLVVLFSCLGLIYHQFTTRRTTVTIQFSLLALLIFSILRASIL